MTSVLAPDQLPVRRQGTLVRQLTHEASGVGLVGADLVVNRNEALLDDQGDLATSQSVLQAVAEEDLSTKAEFSVSACPFETKSSPACRVRPVP